MAKLVITDIDSDGSESATVYSVANRSEAGLALMDDLTRTASQEFSDAAWFQWLDLVNENALPMFTMDNGNGMSVRFEYVF